MKQIREQAQEESRIYYEEESKKHQETIDSTKEELRLVRNSKITLETE